MPQLDRQKAKQYGYSDQEIDQFLNQSGVSEKKTLVGLGHNILSSGAKAVGDLGSALINTVNPDLQKNTIANLGRLGLGAAELAIPGEQGQEKYATNVGKYYVDRYKPSNLGNTLYSDPVGSALDASAVLSGAGAVAKGAGALGKSSTLTKIGAGLSGAGEAINPISQTARLAGSGLNKVRSVASGQLDDLSNSAVTRGMGQPAQLMKVEGKAGRPASELMKDYNLVGGTADDFSAVKNQLTSQYDDLARNSGAQVQVSTVINSLDKKIAKIQQQLQLRPSSASLQRELETLLNNRSEFLNSVGATNQISPLTSPTSSVVDFRRSLDADIPNNAFAQASLPPGSLSGNRATRASLKTGINQSVPELKQLGRDISAFGDEFGSNKGLIQMVKQAESRGNSKNLLNAGKLFGATAGGVAGGVPGAAAGLMLESSINSPKGRTVISNVASAGSKALQQPISPRIFSAAGGAYAVGQGGRLFSVSSPGKPTTPSLRQSTQPQTPVSLSPSMPETLPNTYYNPSSNTEPSPEPIFRLSPIKRRAR